jgi:hypothetical protein
VFQVYGFRLTVFRPVDEHLSQRGVVDNFKITSYNVARNFKVLMDSIEDYARQWAKLERGTYILFPNG